MQIPQLGLDHVGLAIRDLDAACAAFAALGFTLTQRSMHAGTVTPGGPVVPWGSGNHCVMLERGYVELLGLVDEALFSNVKHLLAQYEGLHIVALDCDDAGDTHSKLASRGVTDTHFVDLERDAAFGVNDEQIKRAQFRNIYPDGKEFLEARFIVIEHRTRDVLWQPHLMKHANGAVGLDRAYLVSNDLDAARCRLTQLSGIVPTATEEGLEFPQRNGALWLMSPEQMLVKSPVLTPSDIHRVSAMRIAVRDLAETRSYLQRREISFLSSEHALEANSIWVAPTKAVPTAIEFAQA